MTIGGRVLFASQLFIRIILVGMISLNFSSGALAVPPSDAQAELALPLQLKAPAASNQVQKAAFLMEIYKTHPGLFENVGYFGYSLPDLLNDVSRLIQDIEKRWPPALRQELYRQFDQRKYAQLSISTEPEDLEEFRERLRSKIQILDSEAAKQGKPKLELLQEKIKVFLGHLGDIPSREMAGEVFAHLHKTDPGWCKENLFQDKTMTAIQRLQKVVDALDEKSGPRVPTDFNRAKPRHILDLSQKEIEAADWFHLWNILHRHGPPDSDLVKSVNSLEAADFAKFQGAAPMEAALSSALGKTPEQLDDKEKKWAQRWGKRYSFTSEGQAYRNANHSKFQLDEVTPWVALFRGSVGDDCSTNGSLSPFNPDERVFHIRGSDGKLLGYVSGVNTVVDGKDTFYINSLNGKEISKEQAEAILKGLEASMGQLGVSQVAVPPRSRLDILVNYKSIREGFHSFLEGRSANERPQTYKHPDLRRRLETFRLPESDINTDTYDHMQENSTVMIPGGRPQSQASPPAGDKSQKLAAMKVLAQASEIAPRLQPFAGQSKGIKPSSDDAILYALESFSLGDYEGELSSRVMDDPYGNDLLDYLEDLASQKIFSQNKDENSQKMSSLTKMIRYLENTSHYPPLSVEQFEKGFHEQLRELGYSRTLDGMEKFSFPGILNCTDAFSEQNLEKTARLLSEGIINHGFSISPNLLYNIKNKIRTGSDFHKRLVKTPGFVELTKKLNRELSDYNVDMTPDWIMGSIDYLKVACELGIPLSEESLKSYYNYIRNYRLPQRPMDGRSARYLVSSIVTGCHLNPEFTQYVSENPLQP